MASNHSNKPLIIVNDSPSLASAVDSLVRDLLKAPRRDKYDRAVGTLARRLSDNWTTTYQESLENALRILARQTAKPTREAVNRVVRLLEEDLGEPLAAAIKRDLQKVVDLTYSAGAKDIAGAVYRFDLVDEKAISVLARHNVYWVGKYYSNNLARAVKEAGEEVLKKGLDKRMAGRLFQEMFETNFKDRLIKGEAAPSSAYWEGFANNVVTDGREMGHVGGYVDAGAKTYRVVAIRDKLTSPICKRMHNTVFPVKRAIDYRDRMINTVRPEDVKLVNRWRKIDDIKDLTDADLPPEMSLPTYHFRCRTRTVIEE